MSTELRVGATINASDKMTSLQIAEITGKLHKDVLEAIRNMEPAWVKIRGRKFTLANYTDAQGKPRPCYELSKTECLYIATKFNDEARAKLVLRWEELEMKEVNNFQIPRTFSEALMLAAKQAEQIEQQQLVIEQQKPKAEFYDAVTGSTDTIDMRTVATTLNCGLGRNRIFELLRSKGVLDRKNKPFQRYVDAGYFRTVESSYCKPDGSECINIKTVIFQKGLEFIRNIINQK